MPLSKSGKILLTFFLIVAVQGCGGSNDSSDEQLPGEPHQTGLYLRRSPSDTGLVSIEKATAAESPDIIPTGTEMVDDPVGVFTTPSSFRSDPGLPLVIGQQNFVYVRATNANSVPASARVYLYYAPVGIVLTPDQWKGNQVRTASGAEYATLSASAGGVAVTTEPFVLTPSHDLSLVAHVVQEEWERDDLMDPMTSLDYIESVNRSRLFMRTVLTAKRYSYVVMRQLRFANIDYRDQTFVIALSSSNLPSGTRVSFSSNTYTGEPTMSLGWTTITPDNLNPGVRARIFADIQATLTVSVDTQGKLFPPGASVTVSQYLPVENYSWDGDGQGETLYLVGSATFRLLN